MGIVRQLSNRCLVCDGSLTSALTLPSLPLTGIFSRSQEPGFPAFDQELLFCEACGHGQLRNLIAGHYLYGDDYGFRTSGSATASKEGRFFAQHLERLFPGHTFARVVEFGCNDCYLLELLKSKAEKLLGVDPIWDGKVGTYHDEQIMVHGGRIEEVDFTDTLGGPPDLVISQHTLEHIADPAGLIEKLFAATAASTLFLFEFPCLDILLQRFRFDQVFHQHLHYFSVHSFLSLLDRLGGEVVDISFNPTHWGAMLIAFRKVQGSGKVKNHLAHPAAKIHLADLMERYGIFARQMAAAAAVLGKATAPLYGYGAALMLPVLGYHLQTDFSEFQAILDDDPGKNGVGYVNLPVTIRLPEGDFSEATICLTSLCNRRPILQRAIQLGAKYIVDPLNIL